MLSINEHGTFHKNKLYQRTVQNQEDDKKQFKIYTTLTGFQSALENITDVKTVLSREMSMSQLDFFFLH